MIITIHWLWLPLIITATCFLLAWVFNGFSIEPNNGISIVLGILGVVAGYISVVIYGLMILIFIYEHVKINWG